MIYHTSKHCLLYQVLFVKISFFEIFYILLFAKLEYDHIANNRDRVVKRYASSIPCSEMDIVWQIEPSPSNYRSTSLCTVKYCSQRTIYLIGRIRAVGCIDGYRVLLMIRILFTFLVGVMVLRLLRLFQFVPLTHLFSSFHFNCFDQSFKLYPFLFLLSISSILFFLSHLCFRLFLPNHHFTVSNPESLGGSGPRFEGSPGLDRLYPNQNPK
ncbi:unnamed protein product [Albugo candida]|uniref:Uncharacterized protein n=1 Tax=Albugo candida TaxID=65357 RepID=A0A024G357_9STRA|nr:unnamed protein product [Albugo candida]|eukprot:CCI41200.1 unnamed protein product [Albugo candida]